MGARFVSVGERGFHTFEDLTFNMWGVNFGGKAFIYPVLEFSCGLFQALEKFGLNYFIYELEKKK